LLRFFYLKSLSEHVFALYEQCSSLESDFFMISFRPPSPITTRFGAIQTGLRISDLTQQIDAELTPPEQEFAKEIDNTLEGLSGRPFSFPTDLKTLQEKSSKFSPLAQARLATYGLLKTLVLGISKPNLKETNSFEGLKKYFEGSIKTNLANIAQPRDYQTICTILQTLKNHFPELILPAKCVEALLKTLQGHAIE
jgi:hypothetical protein